MITLCVPTRGRPGRFKQMLESARGTAAGRFEVVAYRDEEDPAEYPPDERVRYAYGPRPMTADGFVSMSGLWSKAWEHATGDIAMLAADDIVFETPGWDGFIQAEFDNVGDRFLMVSTANGQDDRPLLPFVSREWIDAIGFTPEGYPGWMADEWIWSIAVEVGRVRFLPEVMIRHNQFGTDATYLDAMRAREVAGGLRGLRRRFYSIPEVERRDELASTIALRADLRVPFIMPEPEPPWVTETLRRAAHTREHARLQREETVVAVHCYKGDRDVVKHALPYFLHHEAPVLVLSPEDAPVKLRHRGVECAQAGLAAYFGQVSLDRQRAHLELLMRRARSNGWRFLLLNDADSLCLSPAIPRYLYDGAAQGVVYSNEVLDWREHPSPYPKIAMQPPYFLSLESLERMLAAAPGITAHPITPYIDWYMVALVSEAGLEHRTFPDGASFPAWRRGNLPETQQLGHDYVHRNDPGGEIRGDLGMRGRVLEGAVLIHSVKHPEVLAELVRAHADYVRRGEPPVVPQPEVGSRITLEALAESIREDEGRGMGFGESVRV